MKLGKVFYKVLPDKGVVVGTRLRRPAAENLFHLKEDERDIANEILLKNNLGNFLAGYTLKAKAKVSPEDNFDENIGKDIVRAKLDKKQHLYEAREYDKAHALCAKLTHYFYKKCEYHYQKAMAIDADLEKMYGGEIK